MADITEKTENCELVANCDRLVAVDNIEPLIKVISCLLYTSPSPRDTR